ncbi:MAG: PEP-CTERM sorting domain-containing protein [Phycisphaerae bacterium]|nr:PEP-CTERM sorting domain-containing protein [Phycisphaerae bacterium]
MNGRSRTQTLLAAMAAGISLSAAPAAWADGFATGTGQITNIEYGLVNPGDGTINWFWDDGFGGPAWRGEAWVQVSDSQGGAGADYNTTPDEFGVVSAFASTALAWGSVTVDLAAEELYGEGSVTNLVGGWAWAKPYGMMFDYFNITPAVPGSTDPIEMFFSFDYEIHLTGQAEPGAPYYSDANVNMLLEYEDEFGDWQIVPGGPLSYTEIITGSGTESEDVTFNGALSTIVALDPDVMHAVQFTVYPNQDTPEPATLGLLLVGGLLALRRRAGRTAR